MESRYEREKKLFNSFLERNRDKTLGEIEDKLRLYVEDLATEFASQEVEAMRSYLLRELG